MDLSTNDSDDSAFVVLPIKRKPNVKIGSKKLKQTKLSSMGEKSENSDQKQNTATVISANSPNVINKLSALPLVISDPVGSTQVTDKGDQKELVNLFQEITKSTSSEINKAADAAESQSTISSKKSHVSETFSCPLCVKIFDNSNVHISHMKQCAKSKKMTTQQLLSALELQKKHIEERRDLGLPLLNNKAKPASLKQDKSLNKLDNYKLALALAMSKSLEEEKSSKSSALLPSDVLEMQKTTLEKFGFTSSGSIKGLSKKRSRNFYSVLKDRTKEERERIMTEKAAVILLDEDKSTSKIEEKVQKKEVMGLKSPILNQFHNRDSCLWNLCESEKIEQPYVKEIENLVAVITEEKQSQSTKSVCSTNSAEGEDISVEISKLKLPHSDFKECWRKLINSERMSDVSIRTKDDKSMHLHSLVLYVRHPELLNQDYREVFKNFQFRTINIFLEYLYCGELDSLVRSEVEPLQQLSESLSYTELIFVLRKLKDIFVKADDTSSSDNIIPSSLSPKANNAIEDHNCSKLTKNQEREELMEVNCEVSIIDDSCEKSKATGGENVFLTEEVPPLDEDYEWPMIDNMVDLTQSSHGSCENQIIPKANCDNGDNGDEDDDDDNEDSSNADKSYWSFVQLEKAKQEMERQQKQEDEKENMIDRNEMDKIEKIMRHQKEINDLFLDELEKEEEQNLKNKLELDQIHSLSGSKRRRCDSEKDLFEDSPVRGESNSFASKIEKANKEKRDEDCIVLSSDTDVSSDANVKKQDLVDDDNTEKLFERSKSFRDQDFEVPYFDPYEHLDLSPYNLPAGDSPQDVQPSQSLVRGNFSPLSSKSTPIAHSKEKTLNDTAIASSSRLADGPVFFSTPLAAKANVSEISESGKRKRRSDLGARKIIRNSLRLSLKSRVIKSTVNKRRISTRRSQFSRSKGDANKVAELLTNSIVNKLSNSFPLNAEAPNPLNSPTTRRRFLEITPSKTPSVEYSDKVTPLPDYSKMEASSLKKQLAKYGLKRGLGKSKAKKILRHIYEELHPILNTETGKIVKFLPDDKAKGKKKPAAKRNTKTITKNKPQAAARGKRSKAAKKNDDEASTADLLPGTSSNATIEKDSPIKNIEGLGDSLSDTSIDSLERSTDCDSDESEFDLNEPLTQTQSSGTCVIDLPTAFLNYLEINPDFHNQILMYEPIWVEQLQTELLSVNNKKFKLADLMEFLDRKCITFRSEALKKNNERRNKKKKSSPKKKSQNLSK